MIDDTRTEISRQYNESSYPKKYFFIILVVILLILGVALGIGLTTDFNHYSAIEEKKQSD